ncbi:MAG: thioesterase family protein [Bacteroidales bacterium]|nr:thioesterase family protein [Bacteroidales bacterium]
MNDINFKNRLPIQLRFNDIDVIGHVNNSVYFNFFDLGKTAYFDEVMGKHVDWANADMVIRHIEADFQAPTFYRDNIEVDSAVVKIGVKSFTMEQRIVDRDNGAVKCVCTTVMVGFNPQTNQSQEIAAEWKDAIRKYEKNPNL